jgi:hypothetical protein
MVGFWFSCWSKLNSYLAAAAVGASETVGSRLKTFKYFLEKSKPSSEEQLYPKVSQAEIQEVSLVSTDTLLTAFCKAMWQNPIRVEIENVLQARFKVLDQCLPNQFSLIVSHVTSCGWLV